MDKKTLIALGASFFILFAWQKLYIEKKYPPKLRQKTAQTQTAPAPEIPSNPALTPPSQSPNAATLSEPSRFGQDPAKKIHQKRLEKGELSLSNSYHPLQSWELKEYRQGRAENAPNVDLRQVVHQLNPLRFRFFDGQKYVFEELEHRRADLVEESNRRSIWNLNNGPVRIKRIIDHSSDQRFVDYRYQFEFMGPETPKYIFLGMSARAINDDPEERDRNFIYFTNEELETENIASIDFQSAKTHSVIETPIKWMATTTRYFVMAVVPKSDYLPKGNILSQGSSPMDGGLAEMNFVYPVQGKTVEIPFRVYFGPRNLEHLDKVDPSLKNAVDFGFFSTFGYWLLWMLKWFYNYFHNYGIAIILLTILVKIVTFPLNYKSMVSMKKMATLQPQIQAMRDKYKDDREALNREMMMMMKSKGYNPLAGCLPILVQMPVFFALYQVLYFSVELYQAPFAFWIQDLSQKDPLFITPVLMTLTMVLQQKLTPTAVADPAQKKMMQLMPIIFGALMLTLPSGLTLYMLVNLLFSVVQQWALNKKLDVAHAPATVARAR